LKKEVAGFLYKGELEILLREFGERKIDPKKLLFINFDTPCARTAEMNLETKLLRKMLSKQEIEEAQHWAVKTVSKWHSFDRCLEKELEYSGIQLGELSWATLEKHFIKGALALQCLEKAYKSGTRKFFVVRGSFLERVAEVFEKRFSEKFAVERVGEMEQDKHQPAPKKEKAKEFFSKALLILRRAIFERQGKGKKTIFIRSRNYLGAVESVLRKSPELECVSLDDLWTKILLNPFRLSATRAKMAKFANESQAIFSKLAESSKFRQRMLFRGSDCFEFIKPFMETFFKIHLPQIKCAIDELERMFEKKRPNAVILWTDRVAFERATVLVARKHGVKSIVLQHGIIANPVFEKNWMIGYLPIMADVLVVWSQKAKELLVKNGASASKIVVTGNPNFDTILKRKYSPEKLKARIGCGNRRLVTFAGGIAMPGNDPATSVSLLLDLVKELPGCFLAIRPHPSDNTVFEKLVAEKGMRGNAAVLRNRDCGLYELFNASSVVLMHGSTVGLEAMVLGKPVIDFDLNELSKEETFYPKGAVLQARSKKECGKAIETILTGQTAEMDRERKAFVEENSFKCDGKTSERILEMVKSK